MAKRANARQGRIDEIVAALKYAELLSEEVAGSTDEPPLPAAIETELELLRADLLQLGNGLAADVILVATHPEIQLVDIALQRVERVLRHLS